MIFPARPLFPYVGGKRGLAPLIMPLLQTDYDHWIEPFCGGLGLFLAARPIKATLGDANADLIETYTAVRDDPEAVISELQALPVSAADYYHVRDAVSPAELTLAGRAARFIYLQNLAFNGLQRVNAEGKSTAAYGAKDRWKPDVRNLRNVSQRLQAVDLVGGDFEPLVSAAKPDSLVSADPPYLGTFTGYTGSGFGLEDQERLAKSLRAAVDRGVKVLAFNADCPGVRELYAGFEIWTLPIRRNLAGKGSARGLANEVAIMSYQPRNVAAPSYSIPSPRSEFAPKEPQRSERPKGSKGTSAAVTEQVEFVRQLLESGMKRKQILPAFKERFGLEQRTCDDAIRHVKNSWSIEAVTPTAEDKQAKRAALLAKLEGDVEHMKQAGVLTALPAMRKLQAQLEGLLVEASGVENAKPAAPASVQINLGLTLTPELREHRHRLLRRVLDGEINTASDDDGEPEAIMTTGETPPMAG